MDRGQKEMKKILMLDTSVAALNLGDEIINISIRKNWNSIFDENYIVNLPTHTPQYGKIQQAIYKEKMSMYGNADYKFLCGTNALYTNMLRPLPSWNINIFNTKLVKNTICLGVGIGTNSKKINRYTRSLYDKVLSHDYIHSVRDEKAKDFLESMGFDVINTGCPTLWGLDEQTCKNIRNKKADKVVFTLTYYIQDRDNDKKMIECLRKNYEKVYFWPQCYADYKYLYELGDFKDIEIVPANIDAYDRLLDEEIDYVGNRLHGGIFAMQHSCRTIIVGIDYRVREMNKTYTLPSIEREEIPKKLDALINEEWNTLPIGIDLENVKKWKSQFI